MEIQIRQAVLQDLERIKKLHDDTLPVKYPIVFYENLVRGAVDNLVATIRGHDDSEEIVGVITYQTKPPSLSEKPHDNEGFSWSIFGMEEELLCYIMTLCISSSVRRHGIGSRILQRLIDKCVQNERCTMIYLHVHVDNYEAIAFYERHGFKRIRLLAHFYEIDEKLENAYLYVRQIRPAKTLGYRLDSKKLTYRNVVLKQAKTAWAYIATSLGWEHA